MSQWQILRPAIGWKAFDRSAELTDFLWSRLKQDDWLYLNPTSGTSIWERRGEPEGALYIQYDGADVGEIQFHGAGVAGIVSELEKEFGLGTDSTGGLADLLNMILSTYHVLESLNGLEMDGAGVALLNLAERVRQVSASADRFGHQAIEAEVYSAIHQKPLLRLAFLAANYVEILKRCEESLARWEELERTRVLTETENAARANEVAAVRAVRDALADSLEMVKGQLG